TAGSNLVGGLLGVFNSGTVRISYWNSDLHSDSFGTQSGLVLNVVGLSTAELQNGTLPAYFQSGIWTATPGMYPQLSALSGGAGIFSGRVLTLGAGRELSLVSNGQIIATTTTNVNGAFS